MQSSKKILIGLTAAKPKNTSQEHHALFEQNLAGIYQSSIKGKLLHCNDALAKMLKYASPEELLAIDANELYFSPRVRDNFIAALLVQKRLSNYEVTLKCKDGSPLYVIENISLHIDEVSGEEFCDGIMIDITERKRTEREMGWLINNTEESFILVNRQLAITNFNTQAQQLYVKYFGRELVKGACIVDYAQAGRHELVRRTYKSVLEGLEKTSLITIPLPDSTTRDFIIKYKPAKDEHGHIIGAFVTAVDMTEKSKADAQKEFERRDKEALINTTTDLIWSVSSDFTLIAANKAFIAGLKAFTGLTMQPGDALLLKENFTIGYIDSWETSYIQALQGATFMKEVFTPAGEDHPQKWSETSFNPIYNGETITGVACYSRDTTASRNAQNDLIDSNKKLKTAQQIAQLGYWELDMKLGTLYWSEEVYHIWGVSPDTFQLNFLSFYDSIHPDDQEIFEIAKQNALAGNRKMDMEHRIILPNGTTKYIHEKGELVYNEKGEAIRFEGMVQDITGRKEAEDAMKQLANRLLLATDSAGLGIWDWNIRNNYLGWDQGMHNLYKTTHAGFSALFEDWLGMVHVDDRARVQEDMQLAIAGKKDYNTEFRIIRGDSTVSYIKATGMIERDAAGKAFRMIGTNYDITGRKLSEIRMIELNKNLLTQAKELALSNAELEQFAYVASHDLQEPLRMVTSFLNLLEKKYGEVIDDKGKKYIAFAVDGAVRMRQIILDLLEFSRVGSVEDKLEEVNLNQLMEEIRHLFKNNNGNDAIIHSQQLPSIRAYKAPLRQVFQNLVSNALKYRKKDTVPEIFINAEELTAHWQFSVMDNGIGIEKEYFDKIFIIFQRLHNKSEFSGTGMGLAITKKIVEANGGKIWLTSEEGIGTTFYFTLLKQS